ncbi:HAD family hydrolase [Youxingia wuxianensis]|uniref:HAD family hydrolase n=1 Tax=Youxingia wuxianensis TaxID=2763678 RepID=A0A926IHG8_9FIRM|nr:HAD family hydrolase [Youxingia wuxianensis]MBC8585120.1 HAD family hydrolase [Youxingia wuxianensis]
MFQLAIFDLDGTLLNTLEDLANASNWALEQYGLPVHEVEQYRYFVGDGIYKLVERMVPIQCRNDAELLMKVKEKFDTYYHQHTKDCTQPYDGVLETLDVLKNRGVSLAVLSNKPHNFAVSLVKEMFGNRFSIVHGQREGYPRKPDKALVEEILTFTGISPENCLYLGDSGVDMQTAKNGGVYAVGALWGFRDKQELYDNGADTVVENFKDLLKFFSSDC